jgi:hypothetical protein
MLGHGSEEGVDDGVDDGVVEGVDAVVVAAPGELAAPDPVDPNMTIPRPAPRPAPAAMPNDRSIALAERFIRTPF